MSNEIEASDFRGPNKGRNRMRAFGLGVAIVALSVSLSACSNPSTPAGYVGYVTQGAVFGKRRFYELQVGPTSTGLGWLLETTNIAVVPVTIDEQFNGPSAVLSKDNLRINFHVGIVLKVDPNRVKEFVEHYSTTNAAQPLRYVYDNYLSRPLRSMAINEIQSLNALDIKDHIPAIQTTILTGMKKFTAGSPIEILAIAIGNVQYPESVAESVAERTAASQKLLTAGINAQARVVEAKGIADAMRIINATLTPAYLQYEAIKVQKETINSPNHTVIYIPVGKLGVPLVGAFGTEKGK
jgi:regulator of protease activity HflC (stomatin/prohibitin superfamily)